VEAAKTLTVLFKNCRRKEPTKMFNAMIRLLPKQLVQLRPLIHQKVRKNLVKRRMIALQPQKPKPILPRKT
jgi:hypothetical protein